MAGLPADPAVDLAAAMVTAPVAASDWVVVLPVVIPILAGALLVMMRHKVAYHSSIAALALAAMLATDLALLGQVMSSGRPAVMMMGSWLPPFGIAFAADALGALLAATSAAIGLMVAIYAAPSVNTHERRYGFYPFLMLLMAGVTGAFLTGDIFNLYVWFEVLLISSVGLLLLGSEKPQLDATIKYGLLNLLATTLFLLATGYLYGTLGTLNMADIAVKASSGDKAGPLMTIAVLYLLAFGMKAAVFPLNFWLPASYHAPSAGVSALFAALLTKVGVYALLKTLILLLQPQAIVLQPLVLWAAGLTMVMGALGALAQSEIRRALNWLVISGIGLTLVGLALPAGSALTGAIFYAIHSMFVMAALYFAAGLIEEMAGSGELRQIGGLSLAEPMLAGLFLVLSFAVSGLPPFSGFWPKAMLVEASLTASQGWLAAAILLTGFLTMLAMGRIFLQAFWRGGSEGTADGAVAIAGLKRILGSRRAALMGPLGLLTGIVVIIGLFPMPLHRLSLAASTGLIDISAYVEAVLGGTGP